MRKQKCERRGSEIISSEEKNFEIFLLPRSDESIKERDGKYRKYEPKIEKHEACMITKISELLIMGIMIQKNLLTQNLYLLIYMRIYNIMLIFLSTSGTLCSLVVESDSQPILDERVLLLAYSF